MFRSWTFHGSWQKFLFATFQLYSDNQNLPTTVKYPRSKHCIVYIIHGNMTLKVAGKSFGGG